MREQATPFSQFAGEVSVRVRALFRDGFSGFVVYDNDIKGYRSAVAR